MEVKNKYIHTYFNMVNVVKILTRKVYLPAPLISF